MTTAKDFARYAPLAQANAGVAQDKQIPAGPRLISQIAAEIRKTWKPVNYAAAPYLEAMFSLSTIKGSYGYDDAKSIVLYFLSNATGWRGPDAKRIKAELKAMLKGA